MPVGLFGGSFNPPHLGHLLIAETMREAFGLDAIRWMPAYRPPHKSGADLAPSAARLAMTRLATEGHPHFVVSDVEMRREAPSYTVETLRRLQAAEPETDFALILGGDSLRDFGQWYEPEEIVARVPLLVYERPGAGREVAEARFVRHARFADAPRLQISSTDIRARYRAGRSIRYLVPEKVRQYIIAHGLYQDAPS